MKLSRKTSRTMIAAAGVAALLLTATGCSRGGSSSSDELTLFFNGGVDTQRYTEMTRLVDEFEKENGISINLTAEGTAYEDQMKVKLASGDIPDLFSTHGWSLLRYSQFLEPLTDQPWAADVNPALDSAMRDENGDIYAFPGLFDVAGITYSQDALDKAGIDPAAITTWDAFDAAAAKLKAASVTPIVSSGKSQGASGLIADFLAADSFTDAELTDMEDGTFVTRAYSSVLDRAASWEENGWFNADYTSASLDDMARALADGTAGFALYQNNILTSAETYNPDAKLGFIPLPATLGDAPYLVGGEGIDSFGVSKSSTHKEDALAFLDFLAEPDNAAAIAEANGGAAGLTGIDVDFGTLTSSFDAYVTSGTTSVKPYFDRLYLPNGSWNSMVATADSVISGQSDVTAAVTQMQSQYDTLYGQK